MTRGGRYVSGWGSASSQIWASVRYVRNTYCLLLLLSISSFPLFLSFKFFCVSSLEEKDAKKTKKH